MAKPDYFLFFCCQSRAEGHPRGSCGEKGSNNVFQEFTAKLAAKNLLHKVGFARTECLGPCQAGANILVHPDGILYSAVNSEDVDRIIDEHLVQGNPVSEKVAPADIW